jgi:hypothetical protein
LDSLHQESEYIYTIKLLDNIKASSFLMNPEPIADFRLVSTPLSSEITEHLQEVAEQVPGLIATLEEQGQS